jgi:hypothetical protein
MRQLGGLLSAGGGEGGDGGGEYGGVQGAGWALWVRLQLLH